jgi:hypothetical protein
MTEKHIHKDIANVSENARFEAHAPIENRIAALQADFANLQLEKKQLETELSRYSSYAMVSEQKSIRLKYRKNQNKSYSEWQKRKAIMEKERLDLIQRKSIVEQRMMLLKPELKQLIETQNKDRSDVMFRILDVLIQIKDLLNNIRK